MYKKVSIAGFDFEVRKAFRLQDLCAAEEVLVRDDYKVADLPVPIEYVLDVGGHIGCFPMRVLARCPGAAIVSVEVNHFNWEILERNLSGRADVWRGALTYEQGPLDLMNTLHDGTRSNNTGSSFLAPAGSHHATENYSIDSSPFKRYSVEQVMEAKGWPRIDLMKLDCEGSEYSIFDGCKCWNKVGAIVGEYHRTTELFLQTVARVFSTKTWDLATWNVGPHQGLFRISQKDWWNMAHMKEKARG